MKISTSPNKLGFSKFKVLAAFCFLMGIFAGPASAQKVSNLIFFGDSNTDSGRYSILPQFTTGPNANVLNLHGSYTTPGGLMWSQYLGQNFGLGVATTATVNANVLAPGGNNFTAGNARINLPGNAAIGENAWSAEQQISAYLNSTGGKADPNAVYVVAIGTNDLKPTTPGGLGNVVNPGGVSNFAGLTTLAQQTASLVSTLQAAGAKYILVPNVSTAPGTRNGAAAWNAAGFNGAVGAFDQTWINSLNFYNQSLWNNLSRSGINFIPVDRAGLGDYVLLNAAKFGFTNTNIATPACGAVAAIDCLLVNLVAPNAMNTHFFADTIGHNSSAGQKIEADYVYNLLVAPSEISLLGEMPIKARATMVETFRNNIPLNLGKVGERHIWVGGDVTQIKQTNSFTGFDFGRATPKTISVGGHYQMTPHWLLGGGLTAGTYSQPLGRGKLEQTETAGSLYSAFRDKAAFFNAIATVGTLSNAVRRQVTLGITTEYNQADNNGKNLSLALQGGYNFEMRVGSSTLTHGPVVGILAQQVRIDGLTEATSGGGFTALSFAGQKRSSAVSEVGYQANLDFGIWQPFMKIGYHQEQFTADRVITTSLTTVAAPSYTMPATQTGKYWATSAVGVRAKFGRDILGYAVINGQNGQGSLSSYGLSVGVSTSF